MTRLNGIDDLNVDRASSPPATSEDPPSDEQSLGILFTSHPEPMWVYDLHTLSFLAVNDAALAQYGYTRAEFLRMTLTDIRPSEEAARVVDDARRERPVLQHSGIWRHRRKDGSLLDVEITSHTLEFAGRAAVLVSARNVTSRLEAEAALRANEERFRATFEQAAVGMAHVDLDGGWLRVNERLCAIVGYSREELARLRFQDITHPDDLDADLEYVRRLLAGEIQTYTMEKRYIRKDDAIIWVNLTVSLVRDAADRPSYFISVVEDISERKRLERRTRAALDALLAMAEAIVSTTGERADPEAGAAGERVAELTRQVLDCRHVAIVAIAAPTDELRPVAISGFSPSEAARWWRQWEARPRLQDRLEQSHIQRLHSDDALLLDRTRPPFPRETALGRQTVLMVPLRMGDTLTGILSVDHGRAPHAYTPDEVALARAAGRLVALVVERERLMQERAEARASALALREANRRMEEFLSVAGHELRTPLTTVLGNVQLAARWLGQPDTPDEGRDDPSYRLGRIGTLLRRVEGQGRVLNRLVNDMLDTSRIQAGRLALRPAPLDLAALVREAALEQREQMARRDVLLEVPLETVPVRADGERLGQVLANYLSNALKFSAPHQPVTVGLRVQGQTARVWVRDHGPGLSPEQQARIWERFYRVGTEHQDGSSVGLGLGLYISRSIVERHGGEVGVASKPGQGATFWFTIPLARDFGAAGAGEASPWE